MKHVGFSQCSTIFAKYFIGLAYTVDVYFSGLS